MKLWCAVSGHGLGHLAQTAAVLNALRPRVSSLQVRLVGAVPTDRVKEMIRFEVAHEQRSLGVGLVQPHPLSVDLQATRRELEIWHRNWAGRVAEEAQAIAAWKPDLVLADIPYLALEAARMAGVPSVALASLTWDRVLLAYHSLADTQVHRWWTEMRSGYASATLAILPRPALSGEVFPHRTRVPPVILRGRRDPAGLRATLGVSDDRPLVAVTLGGIPAAGSEPPFQREQRVVWVRSGRGVERGNLKYAGNGRDRSFLDVLASVDAVVGKPGYGTPVAAACDGVPYLYVQRGVFPDEDTICAWLHEHGRAREIPHAVYASGDWYDELQALWHQPCPPLPPCQGAERATERILTLVGQAATAGTLLPAGTGGDPFP